MSSDAVRTTRDRVVHEAFLASELWLLRHPTKRAPRKTTLQLATEHLTKRLRHGQPLKNSVGSGVTRERLGLAAAKASGEPILNRKGKLTCATSSS